MLLSATCMLGLTACGGIIQVQRAVEGRTLTVYTEDKLDATQTQEVKETAHTVYPKAKTVVVKQGDGSGVGSSSSGSKPNSGGSKPNNSGGSKPNN